MGPPKPPYLLQHTRDPGARLKLYCGACTWWRTYDAGRIAERLAQKNMLRPSTLIADVARQVQWPCPACRRMRWVTAPADRREPDHPAADAPPRPHSNRHPGRSEAATRDPGATAVRRPLGPGPALR